MTDSIGKNTSADDDHWEIYVTYVDEKPAVILVDIGVAKAAPVAGLSKLVWLWVHLQSPDEDGFPSEDEDFKLNEIEDVVTDSLVDTDVRYVGRITSDGRREFYFYTENPQRFQEIASTAMMSVATQSVPEYRFEIDETDDEDWQHYRDVLHPAPEDFQQIHNQHMITQLQQAGDSLTEPRPVDHFANFKSEQDRESFVVAAAALGYEVASRPDRENEADFPFAVGLLRVDPVDPETIDSVTFELFDLARQHQGEYEGWGSKIVKS